MGLGLAFSFEGDVVIRVYFEFGIKKVVGFYSIRNYGLRRTISYGHFVE